MLLSLSVFLTPLAWSKCNGQVKQGRETLFKIGKMGIKIIAIGRETKLKSTETKGGRDLKLGVS